MKSLFILDPYHTVTIDLDTTYVLMREAQARGHEVIASQLDGLGSRRGRAFCRGEHVAIQDDPAQPIRSLDPIDCVLDDLDVVFMRKDPPFNMSYVFATYLLDGVDAARTLVINRPAGLREANEKCYILNFPEVSPDTLVTMNPRDITAFLEDNGGRCIIKPLDGMGGLGVFLLRSDDPNLSSLIETSTHVGRKHAMCQRYIPEAVQGDKRVILIDGEPVGATLRVPAAGELRGNIHVGARCVKTDLTPRDREICRAIGPRLREDGLYFVGIDVIGDYLTEVNVTSPTGVQEINRLSGVKLEGDMWDWVETRLDQR